MRNENASYIGSATAERATIANEFPAFVRQTLHGQDQDYYPQMNDLPPVSAGGIFVRA